MIHVVFMCMYVVSVFLSVFCYTLAIVACSRSMFVVDVSVMQAFPSRGTVSLPVLAGVKKNAISFTPTSRLFL